MTVFSEPPKRQNMDFNNLNVNDLVEKSTAPLECSSNNMKSLFDKFGYFYFGIGDGFVLEDYYKDATELEKWKFIAICSTYWLYFYEYLHDKEEYKQYKKKLLEWAEINPVFKNTYNYLLEKEKETGWQN